MKGVLILFLLISVNSYGQASFKEIFDEKPETGISYNRKILKQVALCKCIEYYVKDTIWKKDASLSLLYELGNYQPAAYFYIDSITNSFFESMPYLSVPMHKGMLLHCIDFYNSRLLNKIAISADKYLQGYKSSKNGNN